MKKENKDLSKQPSKFSNNLDLYNKTGLMLSEIPHVSWEPTVCLRWYKADNCKPVLQQKWQSSRGEEKWKDIRTHKETTTM